LISYCTAVYVAKHRFTVTARGKWLPHTVNVSQASERLNFVEDPCLIASEN